MDDLDELPCPWVLCLAGIVYADILVLLTLFFLRLRQSDLIRCIHLGDVLGKLFGGLDTQLHPSLILFFGGVTDLSILLADFREFLVIIGLICIMITCSLIYSSFNT